MIFEQKKTTKKFMANGEEEKETTFHFDKKITCFLFFFLDFAQKMFKLIELKCKCLHISIFL